MKKINDRRIRVALVGCGRIAEKHFEAFRQHENNIELVGICDSDEVILQKRVKQTNSKGYKKLEDLLSSSDTDVVTICTPSGLHSEQTIQIAQAGKHVITEKPMATRWADGVNMIRACDKSGVRLFVVKQNRLNATLQSLKQAVDKGRFGRIYMVSINIFWSRPQSYYDQAKWRGTWEFDGGAFMNQASHYIDLLDWLIGPVASVHAMTGTLARNIEVEDTGVLNLRWRSGALGSMSVTMLTYPKNLEGSITIIGETGTVKVGGLAVNEIQHWEFDEKQPEDKHINNATYQTTSVYGFGHPLYYENVIKTLRGEAEADTDGREGLKSLELLVAAYLSARNNKEIALPLEY
jgi:UDP-N-acetyl-2-amino-2-deoxyglucuronate dehydrogenase